MELSTLATEFNSVDGHQSCEHVQYIPGIVSNSTSRGLAEFAVNFSGLHGYIAVAVCLFGVLANSANIVVLTRKHMASSTNILLLWLAVADLLTMLEYLPFVIHFYILSPGDPSRPPFSSRQFYWTCFLLFHASFSIVCHSVAIWLTIALAIFRYIYICKPTTGVFYCSQRRARGVVIVVIVLTIIICIPNCVVNTYDFAYDVSSDNNLTSGILDAAGTDMTTAPHARSESLGEVYYYPIMRKSSKMDEIFIQANNWLQAVLIKLVPCCMLTVLTLLLIHAVHKAYRKRLKLKSQGRKQESDKNGEHNRLTGMLLAIVVLFTLTELPQGILTLMNVFVNCFTHVVYYKLGDLLDLMALINNAVNFVLYCTMSTQFRTTFAAIFCPRQTRQSKWLQLRRVRCKNADHSYTEVSEYSRTTRGNNNGFTSRSLEVTEVETPSKVPSNSTDEQLDSDDHPETVAMITEDDNCGQVCPDSDKLDIPGVQPPYSASNTRLDVPGVQPPHSASNTRLDVPGVQPPHSASNTRLDVPGVQPPHSASNTRLDVPGVQPPHSASNTRLDTYREFNHHSASNTRLDVPGVQPPHSASNTRLDVPGVQPPHSASNTRLDVPGVQPPRSASNTRLDVPEVQPPHSASNTRLDVPGVQPPHSAPNTIPAPSPGYSRRKQKMEDNQSLNETNTPGNGDSCPTLSLIVSNETKDGLVSFSYRYGQLHGYIAVSVCLFGVLSNTANIIVLTRKNMASSTNTILLWLAVCDLFKMLDYLLFAAHFYVMAPDDPNRPPFGTKDFSWICFLLFHASFSIVCHAISIWLTIALAIFRYIYICKPTSGVYYCSQERARFVVIIVALLSIVICVPNYAVNTYFVTDVSKNSTTSLDFEPEENFSTFYYYPQTRKSNTVEEVISQINNWLQAILIKLVPCFMLTTLTLLLVHAMHKAYRRRLKLKSQGRKIESDKNGEHNRITRMLLAVVILFTLTELPQGILTLMNIFVPCFTETVYDKLGDLLDIMALTNNSVNFILYCTMSTQFRTTFATIFCPQRPVPTARWLRLRLVKSNKEEQAFIEDTGDFKGNNNGHISATTETEDTNKTSGQSKGSSEKLPILVECNNGVTSHTHGYYPDHSHV
ncbi:hypothetical protein Btru_034351 [Bulinus truncatus]|nr:hypothetical protein Btru_034351 [Bulinus truncatus]